MRPPSKMRISPKVKIGRTKGIKGTTDSQNRFSGGFYIWQLDVNGLLSAMMGLVSESFHDLAAKLISANVQGLAR